MLKRLTLALLAVCLMLFAFVGGHYTGLPEEDWINAQSQAIADLEAKNATLKKRNNELRQTLDLVKRQIQTDRVAYAEMQKSVDEGEQRREAMLQKFESQRQLLDRLKQKIENL